MVKFVTDYPLKGKRFTAVFRSINLTILAVWLKKDNFFVMVKGADANTLW